MTPRRQLFRLPDGGQIDRTVTIPFRFDGYSYEGHAGDTLASALLANGVRLVGRSFKYHRPRGILSAGSEEPNALLELRTGARREPNTQATMVEIFSGLVAESQNRWPSLNFDLQAVNSAFSSVLIAGFYYKTFMWPAAFWEKLYEPVIRRAAGLGRAAAGPDPDHYEKATAFCDILVIGAGPAGISAALHAARSGQRVVLCDEDFTLGGRALAESSAIDGGPGSDWVAKTLAELAGCKDARIMPRTTVFGVYDGGTFGALERVSDHYLAPPPFLPRQRLWRIVAKRSILAAGAIERPQIFPNNDRPGVMLAGSVRKYLNRFSVVPGTVAVVSTNNDDGLATVSDLVRAGVRVAAIVDSRAASDDQTALPPIDAPVFYNASIIRARGGRQLRAVDILDHRGRIHSVPCDLLATSGGWNPTIHLTSHQGGKPIWSEGLTAFLPGRLPAGMSVAGAAAGNRTVDECIGSGVEAAVSAIENTPATATPTGPAGRPTNTWWTRKGRGKAFIDFQNDVTLADLDLSAREGFKAVEHLKRYTTLGMATDQGKTANVTGLALMAEITGRSITDTGTTTFRPPYTPVSIGAMAGHHRGKEFRPTRLTPTHAWAERLGAVFIEAGLWLRAQFFPRDGERDWLVAVSREVQAVRSGVGICDVTTLGKIDVQGADAAEFLERIYVNSWKNLNIGRARYGVMLREDGFVMDDGTTARLGPDHFVLTTTTNNAVKVMQHMHYCHQWLWPELDVQMVSVTEQWAQIAVAGPQSRNVLQRIVDPPFDLSNGAFPYMAAATLTVCGGVSSRLFRISFSGELAYEIAVPARYGESLATRLMEVGADFGITPYGTEALGVMRIEKGHVAGAELNAQVTARDLGLDRMVSTMKEFIGRAMLARPALVNADRPALAGFRPVDRTARLRAGAHFLPRNATAIADISEGHMTSVAYSPGVGHWIGLGLISRGRDRHGEVVRAYDPVRNGDVLVEILSPAFYDPEGVRLRV